MKKLTRILAVVLVISGLMPFMATVFAAVDQSKIAEMFHFTATVSPELQVTFVMMGAALIFASVIQFLAAAWVWKGKVEGLWLSSWVGIMLIAAGVYTFAVLSKFGISNPSFYAVDLIKGVLILLLTVVALKKTGK